MLGHVDAVGHDGADAFRHEAFLHDGDAEFLAGAVPYIREGLEAGDIVLVLVTAPRVALLRRELGSDADRIHLADMTAIGRNPTRIISAWGSLVAEHAVDGRRIRGLGEPVWPGRNDAELVECSHHEALLNLAFADTPGFQLLCPYDVGALDPAVVGDAQRTHPTYLRGGTRRTSPTYRGSHAAHAALDAPLPDPPGEPVEIPIEPGALAEVRHFAANHAAARGFGRQRVQDVVLTVSELATNTVVHGGGHGLLRIWQEGDALVHEVRDPGVIREPLVGRRRPTPGQLGGRGLWLVNEVCDLVQLRSSAAGTVVRAHLRPHPN